MEAWAMARHSFEVLEDYEKNSHFARREKLVANDNCGRWVEGVEDVAAEASSGDGEGEVGEGVGTVGGIGPGGGIYSGARITLAKEYVT